MEMIFEPVCEKTNNLVSQTKSDTNWAVQSQKINIGWKFWI